MVYETASTRAVLSSSTYSGSMPYLQSLVEQSGPEKPASQAQPMVISASHRSYMLPKSLAARVLICSHVPWPEHSLGQPARWQALPS
jgi:hypothetical protein